MTFLQKSYGHWNKVKKPVMVHISYEGSDDDEETQNSACNFQNKENLFDKNVSKKVEATQEK